MLQQGINVVEIDLTRTKQRLLAHEIAGQYPYHVVIFIPTQNPHFIGINSGDTLARIALPLRAEAIPMTLQSAYSAAYQQSAIAGQLLADDAYQESRLPYPSTMTDTQRATALAAVGSWREALDQLRTS